FLRAETVETEHGGLFYLINLGLFLGLYGDFTSPACPGLALSIWDFVFLLGRRLLRSGKETDLLWDLLTLLAGRDGATPPGVGFEPPEEWRVPEEWLRSFPGPGDWTWAADQGRLRVEHPEGFCVIDVPRRGADAIGQLGEDLR